MGCCQSRPVPAPPAPKQQNPEQIHKPRPFAPTPSPPKEERAQTPRPTKFECNEGHILTWHSDIPHHYFNLSKSWNIRCNICSKVYSSAGWHCRKCNYDMCETCAGKLDHASKPLKCEEGKELLWSPETSYFYREFYKASSFSCNICKKDSTEPNWNCPDCSYDVCVICAESQGYKTPNDLLACREGHHLPYYEDITVSLPDTEFQCDICEQKLATVDAYHCEEHNFDMCIGCKIKRVKKAVPHPGFRCRQKKQMKIEDALVMREESGEPIKCDVCGDGDFQFGYACNSCYQCYCLKCSKSLNRKIIKSHHHKCINGHQMHWEHVVANESLKFKCSVCANGYHTGFFTCGECDYRVCIKDFQI